MASTCWRPRRAMSVPERHGPGRPVGAVTAVPSGRMAVEFGVLGGVRLEVDGRDVVLPGRLRSLVGVLLAERDRPIPADEIVDRLWPADAPKTADKIVQVLVGRLRRLLEPGLAEGANSRFLRSTEGGYELRPGETDLDRYETAARAAKDQSDADAALECVDDARRAWRGRPWGTQADEPWLRARVETLEEGHRQLEELWADLVLREPRSEVPVDRLRAAAAAEPLRERRWAQLIVALYRDGRQAEALRAYDEVRVLLRDELGVEPGPELRRLQIAVLEHDASLVAPASSDSGATSTSFVGRGTRRWAGSGVRSNGIGSSRS